jgi:hypothetical protein
LNLRPATSFIPLILLTLICTSFGAVLGANHLPLPREWASLESVAQQLLAALWVYLDRQGRQLRLPYEFEAFVFFSWPVALPYYLVKSRGARGVLLAAVFFALLVVPTVVAQSVRLLR